VLYTWLDKSLEGQHLTGNLETSQYETIDETVPNWKVTNVIQGVKLGHLLASFTGGP